MIGTWLACSANSVGPNFCSQEEPKQEGEEAGWLCVALAMLLSVCLGQVKDFLHKEAR